MEEDFGRLMRGITQLGIPAYGTGVEEDGKALWKNHVVIEASQFHVW